MNRFFRPAPGPYKAEGSERSVSMWITDANGKRIATMIPGEHDMSTAGLLAASHDMLEALKTLTTGCQDETFRTGERLTRDEAAFLNGAILLAKTIIAKAEGN